MAVFFTVGIVILSNSEKEQTDCFAGGKKKGKYDEVK